MIDQMPREIDQMPKDAYHGDSSSISKSGLAKILAKPIDYYRAYLDPDCQQAKRSASLTIGDAVHRLALEEPLFLEEFARADVKSRATKAYKRAVLDNPGKTILTADEWERVHRMADALWSNRATRIYLELPGKAETSFFWTDPETGVRCKCCPDYITNDSVYALDIKTTRDGSPQGFQRLADEHLYWLSAAMTLKGVAQVRGVRPSTYVFLCVENTDERQPLVSTYHIADHSPDAESEELAVGEHYLRKGLGLYSECLKSGVWPGYQESSLPLGLTSWRRRELQQLRETGELLRA